MNKTDFENDGSGLGYLFFIPLVQFGIWVLSWYLGKGLG